MINTGGSGVWTLAIFDANDLSFSKAFFQTRLEGNSTLNINSNPQNASVFINNVSVGNTPLNYSIPPDLQDFFILIRKDGYNDWVLNIHSSLSRDIFAVLIPGNLQYNGNNVYTHSDLNNISISESSGLSDFLRNGGYESNIGGVYNFVNDYMIYYTLFSIICFILLFSRRD
jgi:hypothetical protein